MSISEAIERRAVYLEAIDNIVRNGKAFNAAGLQYTSADLPDLRAMVAECNLIINGGTKRQLTRSTFADF